MKVKLTSFVNFNCLNYSNDERINSSINSLERTVDYAYKENYDFKYHKHLFFFWFKVPHLKLNKITKCLKEFVIIIWFLFQKSMVFQVPFIQTFDLFLYILDLRKV